MQVMQNALRAAAVRTAIEIAAELSDKSFVRHRERADLCISVAVGPDQHPTVKWRMGKCEARLDVRAGLDVLTHETGDGVIYDALVASARRAGIGVAKQLDPLAILRGVDLKGILGRRSDRLGETRLWQIAAALAYDPLWLRFDCGFPELEFMPLGEMSLLVGLCDVPTEMNSIRFNYFFVLDDSSDHEFLSGDPRHHFLKRVLLQRHHELIGALYLAEGSNESYCDCAYCNGQLKPEFQLR